MLLSSCTFLPEKELAMSRLFLVFSYRTLKWVPGIVTRISSSKTSRIIFDLLNSFMPISRTLVWIRRE